MRLPRSPQTRFVARATLFLAILLAAWWNLLLAPLLAWTKLSTDLALTAAPGATLQTGVRVLPDGSWTLQTPVKVAGAWRNVRVDTDKRLPIQLTVGAPLFWAILLAAPRQRRMWWTAAAGTLLILAIPPVGLLLYAAHVVQMYVFPNAPALARAAIGLGDYVGSTVAPYLGPVIVALALHPELRESVLGAAAQSSESAF
jgi:hypothetical protein